MLSESFADRLEGDLKLDARQAGKVKEALQEAREPMKAQFAQVREANKKVREHQEKLRGMMQDLREKLRAVLNNEQKERFDEMMLRLRSGRRSWGSRGEQPSFGPGAKEGEPSFPPERWEENPGKGLRPRGEKSPAPVDHKP